MLSTFVVAMADHVDHDGARKDEYWILALRDFDSIGVGPTEPLLGNCGDDAIAAGECVFVIEKIALGLEIVGSGHIDREAVVNEREELTFHYGQQVRSA